jgi:hypothetical protein
VFRPCAFAVVPRESSLPARDGAGAHERPRTSEVFYLYTRNDLPWIQIFGNVVPVVRVDCTVPDELRRALFVNLTDDGNAEQWDLLLKACGGDLGSAAPDWLAAQEDVLRCLRNEQSVSLVVGGRAKWRPIEKRGGYTRVG